MSVHLRPVLLATLLAIAGTAQANPNGPAEVHGVRLERLCGTCGVVSNVRTETRKGKASGVGAVSGAVLGGVVGNQFGSGNGRAAMTAVGAVGGGIAGNEIEKNVKKHTVWITTVTMKDGRKRNFERSSNPGWQAGDVVTVRNGQPTRHTK